MKRPTTKRSCLFAALTISAIILPGCVRSMESLVAHRYEHLLPQVERVNTDIEDAFGLAHVSGVSMSVAADKAIEPAH